MLWIWILTSILILAIIALIIVLVIYSQQCKSAFHNTFGKYGDCFFNAAKKNLSKAHFKQVCQIVQDCPSQLKQCGSAVMDVVKKGEKVFVEDSEGHYTLNPVLMDTCTTICVSKYIHIDEMSDEEKTQWSEELNASAMYVHDQCPLFPNASSLYHQN
jgi:hypothetical protein